MPNRPWMPGARIVVLIAGRTRREGRAPFQAFGRRAAPRDGVWRRGNSESIIRRALGSSSRGANGIGIGCAATASTTSVSSASSSSSWSPSHSTRKLPDTPPSTWIVMPGRTSSPSSNPSRSRSKCASPMPHALCVGFSRSCALIAIWNALRFFAIFDVSATPGRLATDPGGDAVDDDAEAVLELLVAAHRLGHLATHLAQQGEVLRRQGGRDHGLRSAALVRDLASGIAERDEAEDVEEHDAEGAGGLGAVATRVHERLDADLGAAERPRPGDRPAQPDLDEAAVATERGSHPVGERPQPVLPASAQLRQPAPPGGLLDHGLEQLVLGPEVAVEGHGPHVELGGEPPHAERVQAVAVDEVQRGARDRLATAVPVRHGRRHLVQCTVRCTTRGVSMTWQGKAFALEAMAVALALAVPAGASAGDRADWAVAFAERAPSTATAMTLHIRYKAPGDPEAKPP